MSAYVTVDTKIRRGPRLLAYPGVDKKPQKPKTLNANTTSISTPEAEIGVRLTPAKSVDHGPSFLPTSRDGQRDRRSTPGS